MKKLQIIGISIILLLAWVTYTPAQQLPWKDKTRLINELKSNTAPFTVPQTFDSGTSTASGVTTNTDFWVNGTGGIRWGDTRIRESSANELTVVIGGVNTVTMSATRLGVTESGNLRGTFIVEVPTATNPTVAPNGLSPNDGIGWNADMQVSIIGGSKELARFDGVVGSATSMFVYGPIRIDGTAGDTSGNTIFFGSGGAAVFESIASGEVWTCDDSGNCTLQTEHIGDMTVESSYNIFNGKKRVFHSEEFLKDVRESGLTVFEHIADYETITYGGTVDWVEYQTTIQRTAFVNTHVQQDIEVLEDEATDFPDIMVLDTGGTVKYRMRKGGLEGFWVQNKKPGKGPYKELKPGYWANGNAEFMRKHTRAEAKAAFVVDTVSMGLLWDKQEDFIKAIVNRP